MASRSSIPSVKNLQGGVHGWGDSRQGPERVGCGWGCRWVGLQPVHQPGASTVRWLLQTQSDWALPAVMSGTTTPAAAVWYQPCARLAHASALVHQHGARVPLWMLLYGHRQEVWRQLLPVMLCTGLLVPCVCACCC
jgi:hypothetical protein